MREVTNECVGCADAYRCVGHSCPLRQVLHIKCDKCGAETVLYEYDGEELCGDCLLEQFPIVEGSED